MLIMKKFLKKNDRIIFKITYEIHKSVTVRNQYNLPHREEQKREQGPLE